MRNISKRGGLSKPAKFMLVCSLILILAVVVWWIITTGIFHRSSEDLLEESNLDLKISQVKKINDNTLDVTLKRGVGEGEFVGLSFTVSDGSRTEVVRIDSSIPENQDGTFSLNFVSLNASKIKSISVTPIFETKSGEEILGETEDEYVTPNTCSNYCPYGAQCGVNGCGMQCGSGCSSGYLCLNYKCIKEKTSSGSSGGGGSSSDDESDENEQQNETVCNSTTCLELGRTCGTVSDGCGNTLECGNCSSGYLCNSTGQCAAETCFGSFNQSCLIENGIGIQIRTCTNPPIWDSWSECTVVSCDLNYVQSGNTCIASTCLGSSTQSCTITNGIGSQSRECINGIWGDWGTCTAISCDSGYTLCGNSCDISSRSCAITNGVGSQSRICTNDVWSSWGTCTVVSCNSCYTQSNNLCVAVNCDDENVCTTDSCSNNICVHNAITGCCTSSSQCNDGNVCTTDSCSNNICVHNAITGCCTSSSQCNDGNVCTTDSCSNNICVHNAITGCCTSSSQCSDGNVCTTDVCSSGVCSNVPISNCCTSSSQCSDGNVCTTDVCAVSTGICSNVAITPCCGNLIIEGTEQCDGTNLNQQTCATRLGTEYTGILSCSSSCTFNTNLCTISCTPETDTAFCSRYNKECESYTALDNCGVSRTVNCGTCTLPETCQSGQCICNPESDNSFCSRYNRECGSYTALDNCGVSRTVSSCGPCTGTCTNGVCITCTNDCIVGARECYSTGYRTCGNSDSDPCTEWIQYPCTYGCTGGYCNPAPQPSTGYLLVDHNAVLAFDDIPDSCLTKARELTMHYAHTSHGARVLQGLSYLESQVDPVKYGYEVRTATTEGLPSGTNVLRMYDGNPPETYITPEDYWYTADGISRTRNVANTGNYDYSMWAWCGQMTYTSYMTPYLTTLNDFEDDYSPGTRFILMTGHTDSSAWPAWQTNANTIRSYAQSNNMILFDYGDIELYDPEGRYYTYYTGTSVVPDGYDSCMWCSDWCDTHPSDCLNLPSCAHMTDYDSGLVCVHEGKAFWWMMARLAGWDGVAGHGC